MGLKRTQFNQDLYPEAGNMDWLRKFSEEQLDTLEQRVMGLIRQKKDLESSVAQGDAAAAAKMQQIEEHINNLLSERQQLGLDAYTEEQELRQPTVKTIEGEFLAIEPSIEDIQTSINELSKVRKDVARRYQQILNVLISYMKVIRRADVTDAMIKEAQFETGTMERFNPWSDYNKKRKELERQTKEQQEGTAAAEQNEKAIQLVGNINQMFSTLKNKFVETQSLQGLTPQQANGLQLIDKILAPFSAGAQEAVEEAEEQIPEGSALPEGEPAGEAAPLQAPAPPAAAPSPATAPTPGEAVTAPMAGEEEAPFVPPTAAEENTRDYTDRVSDKVAQFLNELEELEEGGTKEEIKETFHLLVNKFLTQLDELSEIM